MGSRLEGLACVGQSLVAWLPHHPTPLPQRTGRETVNQVQCVVAISDFTWNGCPSVSITIR